VIRRSGIPQVVVLAIALVAAVTLLGRLGGGGSAAGPAAATGSDGGAAANASPSTASSEPSPGATGSPLATSPTPGSAGSSVWVPKAGALGSAPIGRIEKARVVRVVDGDTIIVDRGRGAERLRYIGMDAPESVDPNRPVDPMGPAASHANAALVGGRTVWLERDVSETDRYGRLLRDVWLRDATRPGGWLLVDLELVAEGWAQVSTYPPDVRYVDALLVAQRHARAAGLGLWSGPAASPVGSPLSLLGGGSQCHPSYSPCLPVVADLDCSDVRAMGAAPVRVVGPDVYRLDADGDGIGCE
jgi:micrococcal nuclease